MLLERFAAVGQPDRVALPTAVRRLRWGAGDSIPAALARAIAARDRPASDPLFLTDIYDLLAAATSDVASG
jgi:hypothetical protein